MVWDKIERRKLSRLDTPFNHEYYITKNRMLSRAVAQDVITSIDSIGVWVKDMEFKFLEISDRAAKILYGHNSEQCIGKSDFEIARSKGLTLTEAQFSDVCRASDTYVRDCRKTTRFIELLKDVKGNPHVWRTTKGISARWNQEYYFGIAMFIDHFYNSYDVALEILEREMPMLRKINDNLYVYKDC